MSVGDKSLETESRLVVAQGWGKWEELIANRYRVSVGGTKMF